MPGLVLYVHPYAHVLDELVPMGAVALMNRVAAPKLGRYAWELTEADLAAAAVLVMDLHWYFSVEAVRWIAAHAKALRPELPIVLGGITASFYARYLVERFPIDYLVQGDGEEAFPPLVEALAAGERPPALPNVWTRGGGPATRRPVPGEAYDGNDYLDLSWFPGLQALTRQHHQRYATAPFWGEMDRYHPYIPLNRGCRFPCGVCFGSWQREVFGPGQVDRSAASLERLLDGAAAHPDYRFVNLTAGTEDMARLAAYRGVLGRRRPLGAYVMHFCALPSDADLQLLLDGFERVCIDFTNPDDVPLPLRAQGYDAAAARQRILDICRALDGEPRARVGVSFLSTAPHPFKDQLRAVDWSRIELKENSEWTLPRPDLRTLGREHHPEDLDQLPALPIPEVARRGLDPARLAAREAAKAAQADAFRAVSEGHARYLLARALSPALYPLLDLSTLQRVDGAPAHAVRVEGAIDRWLAAYTARFRRWHVTTLDSVEVVVAAAGDPVEAPGFHALRRLGPDLGVAAVSPAFDGLRLAWTGAAPAGAGALVLRVRCTVDGLTLDPRDLDGLPLLAVPLAAASPAPLAVAATVSAHDCRLVVGGALALRWQASDTRPASPLLPPPDDAEQPAPRWADPARADAYARALTAAPLAPWTIEQAHRTPRALLLDLAHPQGARLRLQVLPPGDGPAAHTTPHGRLVVQERARGQTPEAATWALMTLVKGAMDEVG